MQINHNSQAIYIDTIANGHTFADRHVYYGNIYVISSSGVQFIGGEYDVGKLLRRFDGHDVRERPVPKRERERSTTRTTGTRRRRYGRTKMKLDGTPFIGGYVSMTPANGAQALTYAQSHADELELLAGATLAFTLTSKRVPAANSRQTIRNNTTQTATFGWKTGTTVTVATATSAVIVGDGTNARKMMVGT